MIRFSLACAEEHLFDAWFRDGATYDRQAEDGTIACPVCGSHEVAKAPMAPAVARGATRADVAPAERKAAELMSQLRKLRSAVEANCDYVGPAFAEEARKIHYGEADARGIYGEATDKESRALADEGVPVQRIPWVPKTQ